MTRNARPWFYPRPGYRTARIDGTRVPLAEIKKAAKGCLKEL